MCGICGYTGRERPDLLDSMMAAVRSRGPDGEGRFAGKDVFFGHTRLAVIDPAGGDQPMTRVNGRFTVCYNGEIYNYDDLRADLESRGYRFTTHCDTELLPIGFAAYGEDLFDKLDGMFAFALLDGESGRLYLVRDHLGIKPLYYAKVGSELVFASSVRAVARHPGVERRLRPAAVAEFLQYRYVRSGQPLFEGIEALPPGTVLVWDRGRATRRAFWEARRRAPSNADPWSGMVEDVRAILEESVRWQLRSDVPVGLFLSGGVDSALIAHLVARHSGHPLTAFTFATGGVHDETESARELCSRYGYRHCVISLSEDDFADLPGAIACMDNPVGDAIVLPTFKLCEAASREVKVVLTGEGADELFGGYAHLRVLRRLDRLSATAPGLRRLAPLVRRLPISLLDRFFDYPTSLGSLGRDAAARLIGALGDSGRLHLGATAIMDDDEVARASVLDPPPLPSADLSLPGLMLDFVRTWLPNDILHKMDQLSMAHGLEARVPYVGARLYDHLLTAPDAFFLDGATDKRLLRAVADSEGIPAAARPKMAFQLPVERRWRRELTALCDRWLAPDIVSRHAILRPAYIEECRHHLDQGEFLAAKRLVAMAALHMWIEANGGTL